MYSLLTKAKKGVTDALAFTSWANLINHPRAKEELAKLISLAGEYQQTISSIESTLTISIKREANFKDLVKFSSKKVAMDSFNKMISQLKANIEYAEMSSKEKQNLIDSFLKEVRKAL